MKSHLGSCNTVLVKTMHYHLCNKTCLHNNGKTVARITDPALMHSVSAHQENGEMNVDAFTLLSYSEDKTGAAYATSFVCVLW